MLRTSPFRVVVVVGVLGALALPTPAGATITASRLDPQTSPLGCADVTAATTTLVGSVTFAGFPAGTITSRPAVATACAGGAGRSISFDGPPSGSIAGTEVAIRGNDETAPLTSHVALARAEGANIHLREVPPGSTVNTVAASGASVDLTPIPVTTTIATTVGGRVVSVRYNGGNTPSTSLSVSVREPQTFVQINAPLPGVPTLVEMRGPDGALVFSRSVASTGSGSISLVGPALASGSSVRMAQSGLVDRTRALGIAEFRADGFRVVLAPGATGGRYSTNLALHPRSITTTDPLGPCNTLAPTAPLGDTECTGLTAPRTEVVATGLLPVAGDSVSVNSNFSSGDATDMAVERRGIYFQPASGDINIFGSGSGALAATLVVPRPNPQPASTFTRTGISFNISDQGSALKGPEAFPVKIAPRSVATFTGGNFGTAGVQAALTLEASVQGASIQGSAEPGARVRATGDFAGFTVLETTVTAAADGGFTIPVGTLPSGAVVQLTSGDPETRTAAFRTLTLGRTPFAIAGASDRQLLRGTVNLSLNTASGDPGWSVSGQPSRTRARTLAVDTGSYPDGPLRVDVAEGSQVDDYLYLIVDNTAPSGGAGPDQQVRTNRDTTLLTNARDANGVTSVVMAFGDGTSLTQRGAEAGTPLTHRYTKAGRFTASVTITDTAGNTTRDDAILTVSADTASRLTGTLPKSVRRGRVLRITQRLSTPGTLRVQLLTSRGKVLSRGAGTALVAGSSASVTIETRRLKRGTYILVRQLVSADGDAGPILTSTIVVKK